MNAEHRYLLWTAHRPVRLTVNKEELDIGLINTFLKLETQDEGLRILKYYI